MNFDNAKLEAIRLAEIYKQTFVVLRHRHPQTAPFNEHFTALPLVGLIAGDDVAWRTDQTPKCAASF